LNYSDFKVAAKIGIPIERKNKKTNHEKMIIYPSTIFHTEVRENEILFSNETGNI